MTALVALGANLGDRAETLRSAVDALGEVGVVTRRSQMYETNAVGGPPGQPLYLNAVVALEVEPTWTPEGVLGALLSIERRHGRTRRIVNEARTLDLDVLDLGGMVRNDPILTLPHPRLLERPFALIPLLDVAPDWRDPRTGRPASEVLSGLDSSGVRLSELVWEPR